MTNDRDGWKTVSFVCALAGATAVVGCGQPTNVDATEAALGAFATDPYPVASYFPSGTGLGFGVSCTAAAASRRADQIAQAERDAWNASAGGSPEAWMALANCDHACAEAMTSRDVACTRLPGRDQYDCYVTSHAIQAACAASCEADLEATCEDEQLAVVANACARKLGAQRDDDTCHGRPPRGWTDVSYRTATGVITHTCYAYSPGI